ncbi:MAG: hypothetical protein ACI4C1_02115 [Lachnospiraceae bacterium]
MGYRVAICDDSNADAEFVQSILNSWAHERQVNVQTKRFVGVSI